VATTTKFGSVQVGETTAERSPGFAVRHYSPAEIAELWGLSVDSVRNIFEREPGVLVIGNPSPPRGKRSYTTLRIPEHVAERVYRRNLTRFEFDRRIA
jgi:hypothetical protein